MTSCFRDEPGCGRATSIILGVLDRILPFRERIAKLPEFDIRNVDCLEDRAKAAWYAFTVNLPEPEPRDFQQMFEECKVLRTTLLTWAEPLVFAGQFERASVDKIKEGSGNKDIPSDVVALVALYRSKWDAIQNMCGVTEEQLDRGATIAPVVFATLARRESWPRPGPDPQPRPCGALDPGGATPAQARRRTWPRCWRACAPLHWRRWGPCPSMRWRAGRVPRRVGFPRSSRAGPPQMQRLHGHGGE
jgi:hypothetical protein